MRHFRAAVLLVAFCITAISATALTLSVNGTAIHSAALEDAGLYRPQHVTGPNGNARRVSGITLGETLPLFFDVYRIEIRTCMETTVFAEDDLAAWLANAVLYREMDRFSVWTTGAAWSGVESISVFGSQFTDEDLSGDPIEIWLSWEGTDHIIAEIDRFVALHGLEITPVVVPNTRSKLMAVSRAGGVPADVVMIQSDYVADLVENDTLQPLDSIIGADSVAKGRSAFDLDGRTWAQPFYFDSHLLFLNPTLVPADLVPETPDPNEGDAGWDLDDLERICAAVLRNHDSVMPISWNAYSAYWLTPFVMGFGRDSIVGAEGYVTVNDEATHEALDYVLDLRDRGYLGIMERDAMTSWFASGRAAMILTGSYEIPNLTALGIPFDVAPYPAVPHRSSYVTPFLDFKGLAIPHRARHPVVARRLIQHLAAAAAQATLATETLKMPANQSAWELIRDTHPYYEVMDSSYRIGTPVPTGRAYATYKSLMWRMLRFAITGQMSVDEVLATGDELLRNSAQTITAP